jgi:glycosyltransferase involved in cell wall biosynthesis
MRVLIDTTYARRAPHSGTGIYVERLCTELGRIDGVEPIEVANRRRRPPAGGGLGSAGNLARDLWWASVALPRLARRAGADLIHHPLPATARLARIPQVVTIVDLAFERLPDHFDRAFRIYAQKTHRAAALAASAVISISETTAADAAELWGARREQMVIAALGPGQDFPPGQRDSEPGHFLYVGDDQPRKNLAVLLEAYRRYREAEQRPLELVLAGSATADGDGVRIVQRPGAAELAGLYRGAAALVHPSLYEGFGLTPVEAMSLGTPVLAARSPGVAEVCADAVRYADSHDPADFAAQMAEIGSSPSLQHELEECGKARAAGFSWRACARAHVEAYSLALGA